MQRVATPLVKCRLLGAAVLLAIGIGSTPGRAAGVDDDSPIVTARQQAVQDRVEAFRTDLQRSGDPRLRILFSSSMEVVEVPSADGGKALGTRTHEWIPAATLYEQTSGSTDPLVLHLMLMRCRSASTDPCDGLDLATRWTQADTQNQVAWIALASVLRQRGDDAGARAAFERAALASRWHEDAWDIARLVSDATPSEFGPLERLAWTTQAVTIGFTTPSDYPTISVFCKEGGRRGGTLRAACLRIVDTMMRDGGSAMAWVLAPTFAAMGQASDSQVALYRQRSEALYWALWQTLPHDEGTDGADTDDAAATRALPAMLAVVRDSERVRAERYLATQRIADSDAAARFAARIGAHAQALRTQRLADARLSGSPTPASH